MIKQILSKQKQHLDFFFEQFDSTITETLINEMVAVNSSLFLTGIGKSGFIAQKIAATLLSTGTKAFFLSPMDALHGDLGMLSRGDFLLVFSKSGETEELLELLPYAHTKGACICAVTSVKESSLSQLADVSIFLPCQNELCPFDLAPTTSTEIQLLFGDLLAMALMRAKGFSIDQFAINHPKGTLGKRLHTKVRDLMLQSQSTPFCSPENSLEEVLVDFSAKRCGCLIVTDEHMQLKGIFTDGDLRRALQTKKESVLKEKIENLMTRSPKSITADATAWEAMRLMEADHTHPITVLPVLGKAEEVIGIIKMHDLIQAHL